MLEQSARMREDLLRQFSSADGSNPLADFQAAHLRAARDAAARQEQQLEAVSEQMVALKLELAGVRAEREKALEVAAEHARGTAKGRPYEEAVVEAVDAIARGQGDDCDAVGDFRAAAGARATWWWTSTAAPAPPRGRIVFEAKNSRARARRRWLISRRRWPSATPTTGSGSCPARRAAGASSGVAGDRRRQAVRGVRPRRGPRLALEVAYSLARARVLMAKGGVEGLDAPALRAEVERALGAMERGAADQAAADQRCGWD